LNKSVKNEPILIFLIHGILKKFDTSDMQSIAPEKCHWTALWIAELVHLIKVIVSPQRWMALKTTSYYII